MKMIATAPFSMEKPVRLQLEHLQIPVTEVTEGHVCFEGNDEIAAKACVNLRAADRVLWEITSFTAKTFDELFDGVKRVNWAEILPKDARIHVSAKCTRSQLMSVPDTARITKMAIVKAMQQKTGVSRLPETGTEYPIEVHIQKDVVSVTLDLCGTSLHKRGYRVKNAAAPLRETFAAGLLDVAGYRGNTPFCDAFCGSGTLVIEAAMIAAHIAPGAERTFACEAYKNFRKSVFDRERQAAKAAVRECTVPIFGADIDPEMAEMTRFHARRAGVEDLITISVCRAGENVPQAESGLLLSNPPYGERLGDKNSMRLLCGETRTLLDRFSGWDRYLLSGYPTLEKEIGLHAVKTRRYYNGNIECNLYRF